MNLLRAKTWRCVASGSLAAAVSTISLHSAPGPSFAQEAGADRPQILALFEANSTLPANVHILEGLLSGFEDSYADFDFYAEYRDVHRFPGPEEDAAFLDQIVSRYAGRPLDAVVLFGPAMLRFGLAHREEFAPDVPALFGGISVFSQPEAMPEGMRGAVSNFDLAGTLDLARGLQPDARRVVVFTGSSDFDRAWEARARAAFADVTDIPVEYVSDLDLEGFRSRAAELGSDTILIILTVFQDAAGESFLPAVAGGAIAAASSAPAYSVYDTFIGKGIVGGRVETFDALGRAVAELTAEATGGGASGPPVVEITPRVIVDWLQLARFGLDPRLLPEDAVVLNYRPTVWERYRTPIVAVAVVLALQSATIALLLLQGRLRRKAEHEARARQLDLARVSRIGHLGELSGALAHELSQPLTAILANAQAGARLATKEPVDMEEIRAILDDIIKDDRRASALIVDLRKLMTNNAPEMGEVDLNAVIRSTLDLVRSELLSREIRVSEALSPRSLPVRGNAAQLQQILLNLVLNAADAMAETPADRRKIVVRAHVREDGWRELSVRDAGTGLSGAELDPFLAFATTKSGGLGLGLSISRTIAEAHGGRIDFDRTVTEGARVVLALPPP